MGYRRYKWHLNVFEVLIQGRGRKLGEFCSTRLAPLVYHQTLNQFSSDRRRALSPISVFSFRLMMIYIPFPCHANCCLNSRDCPARTSPILELCYHQWLGNHEVKIESSESALHSNLSVCDTYFTLIKLPHLIEASCKAIAVSQSLLTGNSRNDVMHSTMAFSNCF